MKNGIFISYSHKDIEKVRQIVCALEQTTDLPVWYDNKLRGGEHYFSVIAEQILDNDYFIFVVSQASVSSSWCINELEFAMSEGKKIVAVWLEDFLPPPRIRLVISNTHYISYDSDKENALKDSLRDCFGKNNFKPVGAPAEPAASAEDRLTESGKYFISREDKKKIQSCLAAESDGRYSECFRPENAVLLGLAYDMGIHTETDETKAEFYYRVAAHKGNRDAEFLYAMHQSNKTTDDYSAQLIEKMDSLADGGSVMAMVYWGDKYYYGERGLPVDRLKAYEWWKAAAAANNPTAQYYIAFGYRKGEVLPKDGALALMYALEAMESGFPRAHRILGFIYLNGEFVAADTQKAIEHFKKAIEADDFFSYNSLGNIYYDQKDYTSAFENYTKAVEYIEAGKLKSANAYYNLAWCYEHAQGTEKNIDIAIDYYIRAVKRNHKSSKEHLVSAIRNADYEKEKEISLLETAAELGCNNADWYLGCHCKSICDDITALKWYNSGADNGDILCVMDLLNYYGYAFGNKQFRDRSKALEAFRLFFSLWDSLEEDDWKEDIRKKYLPVYYYCYAIELDIDRDSKKPDRAHALYYYKKALDADGGLGFLPQISSVALGYLNPETSDNTLFLDIPHGEDIANLAYSYLDVYMNEQAAKEEETQKKALTDMRRSFEILERHYSKQNGLFHSNDDAKEKQKAYQRCILKLSEFI